MSLDPVALEAALGAWLPRADAGEPLASAYVAIIRFLSEPSLPGDARDEINNWLRRAMASEDPEFLIAMAEELVIGTAIYRDLRLARDYLNRATLLSELKGSYATARFVVASDRRQYIACLKRAADLGHLPSRQLLVAHQGRGKRFRRLRTLPFLAGYIRESARLVREKKVGESWWRFRDVLTGKALDGFAEFGEDRRCFFAWARPSPVHVFATVAAKGTSEQLVRGLIEIDVLRPETVDRDLREPERPPHASRPGRPRTTRNPFVGIAAFAIWLWLVWWSLSSLIGMGHRPAFAPPSSQSPVYDPVRNASFIPPHATFDVSIHLQDSSGIFDTARPNDFAKVGSGGAIAFSEPSVRPGGPARGAFLTLDDFDGTTGAATISALPFGWTDAPIKIEVPGYGHCITAVAGGPVIDIRICVRSREPEDRAAQAPSR